MRGVKIRHIRAIVTDDDGTIRIDHRQPFAGVFDVEVVPDRVVVPKLKARP